MKDAIYYPHLRQCHSERSEESRELRTDLELAEALGILRFAQNDNFPERLPEVEKDVGNR